MLIPLYHLRFESYGFHSLVLHTEFVITVRDLFSRSTLFNHICRLPGWRKVHTSLYASHILWPRCVLTHKHAVMDTTCSQFARTRSCFCICTYFQCLSMSFPYSNAPRNASKERCPKLLLYSYVPLYYHTAMLFAMHPEILWSVHNTFGAHEGHLHVYLRRLIIIARSECLWERALACATRALIHASHKLYVCIQIWLWLIQSLHSVWKHHWLRGPSFKTILRTKNAFTKPKGHCCP